MSKIESEAITAARMAARHEVALYGTVGSLAGFIIFSTGGA
jgi:hypothetical protein